MLPNIDSLCSNAKQKYGDRAIEKERTALLLCQAKWGHDRLMPQDCAPLPVSRERLNGQAGYKIRIKAVTVLHSCSAKFQKGGAADKIRVHAGSKVVGSPNLSDPFSLASANVRFEQKVLKFPVLCILETILKHILYLKISSF